MNRFFGKGRMTADPQVRYAQQSGMEIANFNLAIDRRRSKDGEQGADFIPCVAFDKTAEVIEKYMHKGSEICIEGHIQTGSYTNKDGQKVYTTQVIVDGFDFCGKAEKKEDEEVPPAKSQDADGFMNIPDGFQEELPFK